MGESSIEMIYSEDNGPLLMFHPNGQPRKRYLAAYAQEVKDTLPDTIMSHPDGYLLVDSDMLDL